MKQQSVSMRFVSVVLATLMVVGLALLYPLPAKAAGVAIDLTTVSPGGGSGYTYDSSTKVLTINQPGDYTLSGYGAMVEVKIAQDLGQVNLTLNNVYFVGSNVYGDYGNCIAIGTGTQVNMTLEGSNKLVSDTAQYKTYAGILVPSGSSLTIGGAGSLEVYGNDKASGIGSDGTSLGGNITINSGRIVAYGGGTVTTVFGGAGICGTVSIRGGEVEAHGGSVVTPGNGVQGGAGIVGNVNISAGTVTSIAGSGGTKSGAGIGRGTFGSPTDITISGGFVQATGGTGSAGIGATVGDNSAVAFNVTITGGTVVATGGTGGAGIGGSLSRSMGTILISEQTGPTFITANGGDSAAGIGGGSNGNGMQGSLTINGGTVKANGGTNSPGIGLGVGSGYICSALTINGGDVEARGGNNGPGIGSSGGSLSCAPDFISITGGSVKAYGKLIAAGIGSGYQSRGGYGCSISITGGNVYAQGGSDGGPGIGSALETYFNSNIAIGGTQSTVVTAVGKGGAAGIGTGGYAPGTYTDYMSITIDGGTVTATAESGGAGIGGGAGNNAGIITIRGGRITATSAGNAAGIGSGYQSRIQKQSQDTVTISGGRVYANGAGALSTAGGVSVSDIGGTADVSGGNRATANTVTGGSIRAGSMYSAPTDGSVPVYKAAVTVLKADGVTTLNDTDVTCYADGSSTGVSSATDENGKLYLWLPAGAHSLRVTAGPDSFIASGTVTSDNAAVMDTTQEGYRIAAIADQTLDALEENYAAGSQTAKQVTIRNTGTQTLNHLAAALSTGGDAYFALGALSTTTLVPGGTATFSIMAKNGLTAGNYSATVTVGADSADSVSFTVTQAVNYIVQYQNDGVLYAVRSVHSGAAVGAANWPADPAKTGYSFGGWYTGENGTGSAFTADIAVNASITIYAKWTVNRYAVTFDSRGGSAVSPVSANYDYNALVTAPTDPTRTGYTFAGWYKEDTYANAWSFTVDRVPANAVTLYAKWNVNQYAVTFDSRGGSAVSPVSANYDYNALVTAPTDPTRTGYTFAGWYKEDTYANAWSFTVDRVPANAVTLYAKWNVNQYAVTFDSRGGSAVSPVSANYDYNALVTAPTDPTRTGYTFAGWYKEDTCANAWSFTVDRVPANAVTLYAKWNVNQYAVTFDSRGGNAVSPVSTNYDYNTFVTAPTDPTRTGYAFAGWYKEDTYANAWNFAVDKVPASAVRLFAKWTANRHTVVFDSRGGSTVADMTADYGTAIAAPAASVREGYVFGGWYREEACVTIWNFAVDRIAGDVTLYAKWDLPAATGGDTRTLSDIVSGITASGDGLPGNAALTIVSFDVSSGPEGEAFRQYMQAHHATLLFAKDIAIPLGFSGTLSLTIPVGALYNGQRVTILHYTNGALETYTATVQYGRVTFSVNSLSPFAVLIDAKFDPTVSIPKTGDGAGLIPLLLCGALVLLGMKLVAPKTRRLSGRK